MKIRSNEHEFLSRRNFLQIMREEALKLQLSNSKALPEDIIKNTYSHYHPESAISLARFSANLATITKENTKQIMNSTTLNPEARIEPANLVIHQGKLTNLSTVSTGDLGLQNLPGFHNNALVADIVANWGIPKIHLEGTLQLLHLYIPDINKGFLILKPHLLLHLILSSNSLESLNAFKEGIPTRLEEAWNREYHNLTHPFGGGIPS